MPKRRRSRSFKTTRARKSKRSKVGRAAKGFSARAANSAVAYHPWSNYRPRISRALAGYSDDGIVTKLTSSAIWSNSSIGIFTSLDIYANSVSDPFGSGGSIRPPGYTQYSGLYNYVAVMAASIQVKWLAGSTATTGNPHIYGVFPQAASNGFITDYSDALSQNRSKYAVIDVTNGTSTGSAQAPNPNANLMQYFTTAQIMGQNKGYYMSSQNNSSFTADPTLLWYYTVWKDTVDSSSTYTNQLLITLTQYVRCWGRKALADV